MKLLPLPVQLLTLTIASPENFWGLGKVGLVTTIIVSVILIATVVWLINGTRKRD